MARNIHGGRRGIVVGLAGTLRRFAARAVADASFARAMAAVGGIGLPPDTAVVVLDREFREIERWLAAQAPAGRPDGTYDVHDQRE